MARPTKPPSRARARARKQRRPRSSPPGKWSPRSTGSPLSTPSPRRCTTTTPLCCPRLGPTTRRSSGLTACCSWSAEIRSVGPRPPCWPRCRAPGSTDRRGCGLGCWDESKRRGNLWNDVGASHRAVRLRQLSQHLPIPVLFTHCSCVDGTLHTMPSSACDWQPQPGPGGQVKPIRTTVEQPWQTMRSTNDAALFHFSNILQYPPRKPRMASTDSPVLVSYRVHNPPRC